MGFKDRFVQFMRGTSGRLARVGLGVALITAGLLVGGTAGIGLAVLSVMPIGSGVTGVCPLGPAFGVDFRGRPRDRCA
jgi:hypothetical protein